MEHRNRSSYSAAFWCLLPDLPLFPLPSFWWPLCYLLLWKQFSCLPGGQRLTLGVFLNYSPYSFRVATHWTWNLRIQLDYLASKTQNPPASTSPEPGLQVRATMSDFHMGVKRSEFRSYFFHDKHFTNWAAVQLSFLLWNKIWLRTCKYLMVVSTEEIQQLHSCLGLGEFFMLLGGRFSDPSGLLQTSGLE